MLGKTAEFPISATIDGMPPLTPRTRVLLVAAGALLVVAGAVALVAARGTGGAPPSPSPSRSAIQIHGTVTDLQTGKPVPGVCVTLGRPGAICWATTDSGGNYFIDGTGVIEPSQTEWELYFTKAGEYPPQPSGRFKLTGGRFQVDAALRR